MSAFAKVEDGQIINGGVSQTEQPAKAQTKENTLDKDAFLQLLVAQMKYQDPLEPTSNTEYISQLATFSSLEEMQNMGASMEMSRASALVGQYVFMKVTDSAGKTTYPEGTVDYVVYQNGKTYLSINETLYDMADLDTIADPEYLLASRLNQSFADQLHKLPKVDYITDKSKGALADIEALMKVYEKMTEYQKSFITKDNMELFESYVQKYNELKPEEGGTEEPEDKPEEKPEEKPEDRPVEETV